MGDAKSRRLVLVSLLAAACGTGTVTRSSPPSVSGERSALEGSAARVYADDRALVTITATARAADGTLLPGKRVEFLVSGVANRLSEASATTDGTGRASVTLASAVAETKVVSASIDGLPVLRSLSIAFVAGPPAGLRFSVPPRDAIAGTVLGPAVEVEVVDTLGRVVDEGGQVIALSLQGGDSRATLHGTLAAATVGGVAAFPDLWLAIAASSYVLNANADTLPSVTSGPFAVVPSTADPASSEVVAATPQVAAGRSTALTVTVRDRFGNPVAGETVSLVASGSGNQLAQPTGATDANGQAVGSLGSNVAGLRSVSGYLAGARPLGGLASVTFVPGPPASGPGASTLVAWPPTGRSDGTPVSLTATLKDAFGNAVPGVTLTLASSGGASCTSPAGPTDAAGVATGSVSSWSVGAQTISALVGTTTVATVTVTFAQPQVSPSLSSVMATPGTVVADGVSSSTVTVAVFDTTGRPLPGALVGLAYAGAGSITPPSSSTDAAGRAVFQVTASAPTTGLVTATATASGGTLVMLPQGAALAFSPPRALGGAIAGLVAGGLVLASPGLPDLAVAAGATTFTFARPLPDGGRYAVTLRHAAAGQVCQVTGGVGTAGAAGVTDVAVTCASPAWASVTIGAGATYAFNADGSLWAWGYNASGQVGAAAPLVVPTPFRLGDRFVAIAGGTGHTVALEPDGSLWAWGDNGSGQLGDGTTSSRLAPVLIGAGFARVAAGTFHSLAVGTDGSLWAWGDNSSGQLGDGTTTSRSAPVPIGLGYSRVAAGDGHSVALKVDGTLWAWGNNYSGQVGDGSDFATTRLAPVQVGGGFSEVMAGFDRSAGLKVDGTLWAWGSGSVGDGSRGPQRTPFLLGPGFASAALGSDHTCALKGDGTLWAWGGNGAGAVGDGTTAYRTTPVQVATGVAAVAAGYGHTVVVKRDGSLWAWGSNQLGELGLGAVAASQLTPFQTVPGASWTTVSTGANHSLAVASDQALWAWGNNDAGQLGDGTTSSTWAPVVVGTGFTTATGGEHFSAAVKTDGSLWTWGFNSYGQLGDGSTASTRRVPASIGTGFQAVAAGFDHAAALRQDGTVWAFGNNLQGQVGDGTSLNERRSPVKVQDGVARLAASSGVTLSLEGDGTLWGWGDVAPASMVPMVRGTGFKAVASGIFHRVAVKADGTLWGWGSNAFGQVGDGSGLAAPAPVQIGTGFVAVAAGHYHSMALKTDGTLWAWGENGTGQLGDATTVNRPTPIFVASGVAQFAAGQNHSLATLTDGTIRAWGSNYGRQLGAPWSVLSPVQVR